MVSLTPRKCLSAPAAPIHTPPANAPPASCQHGSDHVRTHHRVQRQPAQHQGHPVQPPLRPRSPAGQPARGSRCRAPSTVGAPLASMCSRLKSVCQRRPGRRFGIPRAHHAPAMPGRPEQEPAAAIAISDNRSDPGRRSEAALPPRPCPGVARCRSLERRSGIGSRIFVELIASGLCRCTLYCKPVEPIAPSTSHLTLNLNGLSVLAISCPAASTWLPLLSFSGPL